ncbi:tyrosine-type recombinase/integrase [Vibrio mexicanus]|uniref:tyrosine-type recombinase/integrase n=1 Tax=Vibrio mexicanus TaxID=1004326 RepID=UPI00063CF711|nr:tyrosine-type recombinase/integrase [Vibrio mexicanus]
MAKKPPVELPTGIEVHGNSIRIAFSYMGVRYRETLGLSPNKQNLMFASRKREAILYDIRIGVFKYLEHFPESKHAYNTSRNEPLNKLANQYLESREPDVRSATLIRYRLALVNFLNAYGKTKRCHTLCARSLVAIKSKFINGRGARTVNRELVTVNAFLTWLHKLEYVDKNLSNVLTRLKETEVEINPFSKTEISLAISQCNHLQHKNAILVLVYTGIRLGELCALAWEDVDFENERILVRRSADNKRLLKTTKTDTERYVDLLPPALEALKTQRLLTYDYPCNKYKVELADKSYRTDTIRFVFNPNAVRKSQNGHNFCGKRTFPKIWQRACEEAKIPYRNIHQLRHTYASWLITHANVNLSYLAKQMGHANINMIIKVYGKWLEQSNKKESLRVWNELRKAFDE